MRGVGPCNASQAQHANAMPATSTLQIVERDRNLAELAIVAARHKQMVGLFTQ